MKIQENDFKELEAKCEKYDEVIMAVETKYPGETKHQTALELIKKAQQSADEEETDMLRCKKCGEPITPQYCDECSGDGNCTYGYDMEKCGLDCNTECPFRNKTPDLTKGAL